MRSAAQALRSSGEFARTICGGGWAANLVGLDAGRRGCGSVRKRLHRQRHGVRTSVGIASRGCGGDGASEEKVADGGSGCRAWRRQVAGGAAGRRRAGGAAQRPAARWLAAVDEAAKEESTRQHAGIVDGITQQENCQKSCEDTRDAGLRHHTHF